MTQVAINWIELVKDVTDAVRKGATVDQAVAEIAIDYDANPVVLRVRFDKAWPAGVMAQAPSEEEMLARRRDDIRTHNARVRAEEQLIVEFFATNPSIKLEVRRNITKFTGRRSCSMREAKTIADRIAK